jgi:hypothetical protein
MRRAQAAALLPPADSTRGHFKICFSEEASSRKPPNLYDLRIHTSAPDAIPLDPLHASARRIEVPFVPGAFLIADLFTADECLAIIQAGKSFAGLSLLALLVQKYKF